MTDTHSTQHSHLLRYYTQHSPSSHSSLTVALSLPCCCTRLKAYLGSYKGTPEALLALGGRGRNTWVNYSMSRVPLTNT